MAGPMFCGKYRVSLHKWITVNIYAVRWETASISWNHSDRMGEPVRKGNRDLGNSCHQTNAILEKCYSNSFAWQFESGTTFAVSFLCGDMLNFSISHISRTSRTVFVHHLLVLSLSLSFSLTHTRMPDSFEYLLFLANTRLWPVTSFLVIGNETSYANKFEKLNRPSQGSEKFWMISKEYIQHYLWQT